MFNAFTNFQRQQLLRDNARNLFEENLRRRREADDEYARQMRHRLVMSQALVIEVAAAQKAEQDRLQAEAARKR